MNAAVTPALGRPASEARVARTGSANDRLLGIALMAIPPAIFWVVLVGFAAAAFGFEISATSLAQIGAGIALFLAVVGAAVTQRQS